MRQLRRGIRWRPRAGKRKDKETRRNEKRKSRSGKRVITEPREVDITACGALASAD